MWNKLFLFISSYIPLYVLLILKNLFERITDGGQFLDVKMKILNAHFFDEVNDWAICILSVAMTTSLIYLYFILKRSSGNKAYNIIDISDETPTYYFNYISIYLLSCMGLSLNSIVDCCVFLFLMIIVGYIYISNNMMYMNPVINLMGYKVYDCILNSLNTPDEEIKSIVVASRDKQIKKGTQIIGSGKQGFIYITNANQQ